MKRTPSRMSILPFLFIAGLADGWEFPLSAGAPSLETTTSRGTGMIGAVPQAGNRQDTPLFLSDEILELELEADWEEVDGDRGQESSERPGRISWTNAGMGEVSLSIELRTRGNFRLRRSTCRFPPLRLDFPSEGTEGTVFQGQDKVKLVTHCRDRDDYEQNVLEEYLAYRIYNLLTDISFRVRLARITYVDSREENEPVTRFGFLIEDDDAIADRLGGLVYDVPGAAAAQFQQDQAGLMYIFQFMIGNTDWSMTQFHNTKVMGVRGKYFSVPYDFDWSGLVDAPYAGPNPRIANLIDNVRQRLYMGHCDERIQYQMLFDRFREKEAEILALPLSFPGLKEDNQRSSVGYLEDFFQIIDREAASRNQIVRACRL